ncbi:MULTISPECIES: prepilin peptidase-dependent protein [Providencia]|uniref:Prepilin peptidase-dependent protein n=1 Tax=Providencia stuartii TaxID=588 RepID=A0ABD5L2A4_PROST|nr:MULTISPECIES: prepilin peptidase-dependent protein [Providencia]ELR5043303.1 prepilin peptidase-dependent protein [Providencia rettgeri]MCR4180371.1 prepilin peptidase-dependent protein [Providencia vermicola]ELR5291283.1 prepilin peptidase-dependent protein [Providencia stuartii]ELZ5938567.1 prepilin peptidase-dependent protein [Providencia stuartii]MCK1141795.1 prepilin peptidase-dependent protein [Providencia stuartii]
MNINKQQGFSLIEVLLAMAISSLVCIAATAVFPRLFKQTHQSYIQYEIDREIRQVLINMEKDFRRIGYCSSASCQGEAMKIDAKFLSHHPNSCIIFAYDQNLSGSWRPVRARSKESDFFGYRLNGHKLESNRNVEDCDGKRWQSLFDPLRISVNSLRFNWYEAESILEMYLSVESPNLPNKRFHYKTAVLLRNL